MQVWQSSIAGVETTFTGGDANFAGVVSHFYGVKATFTGVTSVRTVGLGYSFLTMASMAALTGVFGKSLAGEAS